MQEAAIMVTGGAGGVGRHVIRRLADKGRTVVAVYHHKLPESLEGVYPVCADFSSAELMAAPLRGVDTVVHLAWSGGLSGPAAPVDLAALAHGAKGEGEGANLRMLRHLLVAMERAGTRRLILVSAAGASRASQVPFLQEKYAAESLVLNSQVAEKIILRSAVVWGGQGADDRLLASLLRLLKYPVYPVLARQPVLAPVHVQDLAQVVVEACTRKLAAGADLQEVHGGQAYRLAELLKIVNERYVKKPRLAVGGLLAESLMPLLERDRRGTAGATKLAHFLAIGGLPATSQASLGEQTAIDPRRLAAFHDRSAELPAPATKPQI